MDNKNEIQEEEFDLDDILNEFHDAPETDSAEVEPDEELEELLQMPELTITPVVIKETAIEELISDDLSDAAEVDLSEETKVIPQVALEGDTVMFAPITEEQITQAAAAIKEAAMQPDALTDDTIQIPVAAEPEVSTEETIKISDLSEVLAEATAEESKKVEPAFEVEEEFIPAPIVFTPRSRLKELKKELVAGPEKRYYELSEIVLATLERYRVLFPEEEVVFLSLPLDDQEERSAILRQAVEWSGRRE